MHKTHQSQLFLILAIAASIVLVYFIVQPFLGPLILAGIFAFLLQPVYQRFLAKMNGRESLAAFITTLVAIVLVLMPIMFLGTQIFKESSGLYQSLSTEGENPASLVSMLNEIRTNLPIPVEFEFDIGQYVRQGLDVLVSNLGAVFSSFAKMLLDTFVFLTALYFFSKDGQRLKDYLVALSPLDDGDDELLISRLKLAVGAAVRGNLAIGLIQGTLTGIGFAIFGVPNPVLWGSVAVIAAFLPGIGTALVIAPAVGYLFFIGNSFGGVGLLVWGVVAVGLVDNFLGPKLVGHSMQLHPLAVFVSVLGGLALFGPLGFLLGPLVLSVCLALLDIYSSIKSRRGAQL